MGIIYYWIDIPAERESDKMENQNSNNSKDLYVTVRTEEYVPSALQTCVVEDERTLLEDQENKSDDAENDQGNLSNSNDSKEQKEKPKRYTRHQKLTFAGFAFVLTADLMLYSVLAPFYPIEVKYAVLHCCIYYVM